MDTIIRKAKIEDKTAIMDIIAAAIIHMDQKGIYQWDKIYPDSETICEDILQKKLFVSVDDYAIKGIIVLNEEQAEEYEALKWRYAFGKQLIIHRLCVDPRYQGKGIAKNLINFAENFAKSSSYEAIRLDAFTQNERACKMYEQAGYEKVGTVNFRKGKFYCYEKALN